MRISVTIIRTVYLMCLTLALLVALTSYMSGASFEAVISRSMLALVGAAVLGLTAILVLAPTSNSMQAGEERVRRVREGSSETERADDTIADAA